MAYDLYPAVDENHNFPPVVRQALAASTELRNTVLPLTTSQRDALSGAQLWDGRTILNTTTDRINRYDLGTTSWKPVADLADVTTYLATVPGMRNRIINGDFSVNQRGLTTNTSTSYGFDRWAVNLSGGSCEYKKMTQALGDLPESMNTFARIVTSGQSAAGDLAYLTQRIENVRSLSGKTVTVSFWARANSGTPKVAVAFSQQFGSGGSSPVEIIAGHITLSTVWAKHSISVIIPSLGGKTISIDTTDHLGFRIWTSAGSTYNAYTNSLGIQNTTIDIWGVQVEEGPVASPFEQKSYSDELRACMRYYRSYDALSGFVDVVAADLKGIHTPWLGKEMRPSPIVTCGTITYATSGVTIATNPTCIPTNSDIWTTTGGAATGGAWVRWNAVVINAEL